MNEILVRKYIKQVVGYGIPKLMAQNIVEVAMEVVKNGNYDKAINYCIDLQYGLGFSKRVASK